MNEQIVQLYNALEESCFTVAITGTGISISAGGVTFDGMINNFNGSMRSNDPQQMHDAFDRAFFQSMFHHGPTPAHKALAKLEKRASCRVSSPLMEIACIPWPVLKM